jgi:hypothetical protein
MKHTQTPWETDKIAVRSSGPNGRQICLADISVRGRPYDETYDEAIANATFIVTACNAYYTLTEQRDELLEALELLVDGIQHATNHEVYTTSWISRCTDYKFSKAKEAIKKARGAK